jgi:hypothetical protein
VYRCNGCGANRADRCTADGWIDIDGYTEFVGVLNLNRVDWARFDVYWIE